MITKQTYLAAAKAEDTMDLLDHISWREVIQPALLREREVYTKLLVSATLGAPIQIDTPTGPVAITKEQLAGKIFGIDWIMGLFERIIRKGSKAIEELRAAGLSVDH